MFAALKRLFTGAEKSAPSVPNGPICDHSDFLDLGEGLRVCKNETCRQVLRFERAPVGNPDGVRWIWRPLARDEALPLLADLKARIAIPKE